MLVSQDWLTEYVKLPDHDELVDRLTMTGLNHEGSEPVGSDTCIDLEVTSNRSDCLGHVGVAREISALFAHPLNIPPAELATAAPSVDEDFAVEIQCPELCYRFTARLVRGVKVGPSPQWLVDRLATIGVESVNNIVDISNYVMFECGQPLHAFDYDKLQGNRIIVREPQQDEKLEAINHTTYELQPGMCVIADGSRAVGLGGVMGGAETEVSNDTVNVLVEAAHFNPMSIRATARKLNLHSAASFRFERTINPDNIDWASRRCCELIQQIAGGEVADGFIDVGAPAEPRQPIRFRFAQLDRILGIEIPRDRAVEILESLGFSRCLTKSIGGKTGSAGISLSVNTAEFPDQVKDELLDSDADEVTVIPPPWRLDVTREVDLIEEVGRVYGYEHVPDDIEVPMAATVRDVTDRIVDKVRGAMNAAGFDEAMTASLVPQKWSDSFSPWTDHPPLQSSQPMLGVLEKASQNVGQVNLLRRSLVPSLLEVFRINEYKQNRNVDLFEIARVYLPHGTQLPQEPLKLGVVSDRNYWHLKGTIESMIGLLNARAIVDARACDYDVLDPTRAAELLLDGQRLGWIGEVSDYGKEMFGFRQPATVAELDLSVLFRNATVTATHSAISPYPAITRDFNFVVDESVRWSDVARSVRQAAGDLLESVTYKETFRDTDKDGEEKKRVLLSVVLRSIDTTLTGDQAEAVCHKIIEHCGKQHAAKLLD